MKKTADVIRKLLMRSSTSRNDKIEVIVDEWCLKFRWFLFSFFFQLKQFAIELLHRKINFTVCGFFPLDRTLVHSVSRARSIELSKIVRENKHLAMRFYCLDLEHGRHVFGDTNSNANRT